MSYDGREADDYFGASSHLEEQSEARIANLKQQLSDHEVGIEQRNEEIEKQAQEIARLQGELTRIDEDKKYLHDANVANEWEARYQCQKVEIEQLKAEREQPAAEIEAMCLERLDAVAICEHATNEKWAARWSKLREAITGPDGPIVINGDVAFDEILALIDSFQTAEPLGDGAGSERGSEEGECSSR